MKNGSTGDASVELQSHEVHLFYKLPAIGLDDPQSAKLGNLAETIERVFPPDQCAALKNRYQKENIWRPVEPEKIRISPDLNPAIRQILKAEHTSLLRCWTLSPIAERLLKRSDLSENETESVSSSRKLFLSWSNAAKERLQLAGANDQPLTINPLRLRLWVFGTGVAFAELRLNLSNLDGSPLHTTQLQETVSRLSRRDTLGFCQWHNMKDKAPAAGEPSNLGAIVNAMCLGELHANDVGTRVASYSFAHLSEDAGPEKAGRLAANLARRYTDDDRLDPIQSGVKFLRDFLDVRHAVSLEGAATVILPQSDRQLPEFLLNFRSNSFANVYSPLALLFWHERAFLARGRVDALKAQGDDTALEDLTGIVDDALMFRLYFRHVMVSEISMHNDFGSAFRQALGLDQQFDDLQRDVDAVRAKLVEASVEEESAAGARRAARFHWTTVFGAASLAGLTAYTIGKEFLSLLVGNEFVPFLTDKYAVGWSAVSFGAFIFLAACLVGIWQRPKKANVHHGSHLTMHAMQEHMIKRALAP